MLPRATPHVRRWPAVTADGATCRLRDSAYPAGFEMPAHEHGYAELSVVLAGAVREEVGGTTAEAFGLHAVVKSAGTRHANRIGPAGATIFSLHVEGPAGADSPLASLLTQGWRWTRHVELVGALLRLRADASEGDTMPRSLEHRLWEASAALATDLHPDGRSAPPWLHRVVDRLHAEYLAPPSVPTLAADAGVHPVHLTRALRRFHHCTVMGLTRHLRLRHAANLIATTGLSLAAVAAQSGFADESHLCRALRRDLRVRPSALRGSRAA